MQSLHSLFNREFMDSFNNMEPRTRRLMLPYVQSVYRRWYHSTLVENIHFTPANITEAAAYFCDMPSGTYIVADITQPLSKLDKLDFKVLNYSLDAHPAAEDLRQIVKMCTPHIDLCVDWCLSEAQAAKAAKKVICVRPLLRVFFT
jgi:hypothetical protein